MAESTISKLEHRIEQHLRVTSRQLIKFDTEIETLQFLIDSFQTELSSDFVGVILYENDELIPKVMIGESSDFNRAFPMKGSQIRPELLDQSCTFLDFTENSGCAFTTLLTFEQLKTWFTVPLKDHSTVFGLCVIGFKKPVELIHGIRNHFEEFGKDIAAAIHLVRKKEAEKKKRIDAEWIQQNISLDESLENVVEKIVERAGKSTHSKVACIYLFDEGNNCFVFQPPSFGDVTLPKRIQLQNDYMLKNHFPNLEQTGGTQLTVPLIVDLKTIGVLHVEAKQSGFFGRDDLELLELLSIHVAAILENARLYRNEKEHQKQLQSLLDFQKSLIKETVEQDNFDGITALLYQSFSKSIIVYDRFMRPISSFLDPQNGPDFDVINKSIIEQLPDRESNYMDVLISEDATLTFRIWPINGGGNLLGYLAFAITRNEMDEFHKLSIELSLNVYSIQFIKQKLVYDAKEQVKDGFINKLLVEQIDDPNDIIQYANVFNWDLFKHHRVSILSFQLNKNPKDHDIFKIQEIKTQILDQLKRHLFLFDGTLISASKGGECIMISPIAKEKGDARNYWKTFHHHMLQWIREEVEDSPQIHIGVGGKTTELKDYYISYQQAIQALHVISQRFNGKNVAFYEDLGSYTLLHHLSSTQETDLFIKHYLAPVIDYSEKRGLDFFDTLRVFLNCNGNLKETSEELFIQRSTLQYRLEKIQSLLGIDISSSEERFNLQMAFKLFDLSDSSSRPS